MPRSCPRSRKMNLEKVASLDAKCPEIQRVVSPQRCGASTLDEPSADSRAFMRAQPRCSRWTPERRFRRSTVMDG